MYGQTEATARMSYLPADQCLDKIGSIGIAIPGGRFYLEDADKTTGVGELIYEGENVSLGMAECREDLKKADHIILPGVGAYGDAIAKLRGSGMAEPLLEEARAGKPIMGICLGMQLLFDKSYEYGKHRGLGLIPGVMADLREDIPANLKVPHMGWNSLHLTEKGKKHPLFKYSKEGDYVYFVHSFYGKDCDESLLATSEYGIPVTASAANENVMGCQFHPEKSGEVGLRILKAFSEI